MNIFRKNVELGMVTQSVKTTFDNEWDVMPAGRKKFSHLNGVVCPFKVEIKESPFTGVLKSGTSYGLIRFAIPGALTANSGISPGGGIKFFRSGVSSANLVIANRPLPNNNHDFFSVSLSNHIPEEIPTLQKIIVAPKFCQAQSCLTKVGLSNICTYDQDGNRAENVKFPFKVI